jgi:hypothetical protein
MFFSNPSCIRILFIINKLLHPPPLFSLAEEIQGAKILKNKKQNVQHFVSRLFIPLREKIYKKKKNETN